MTTARKPFCAATFSWWERLQRRRHRPGNSSTPSLQQSAASPRDPPEGSTCVQVFLLSGNSAPATFLRSLLLLAGDIHPNPGPVWPCPACSRNAARGSVLCTSRALESATVETYLRDGLVIPAPPLLLLNVCLHLHLNLLLASQLYLLLLQSPHPI